MTEHECLGHETRGRSLALLLLRSHQNIDSARECVIQTEGGQVRDVGCLSGASPKFIRSSFPPWMSYLHVKWWKESWRDSRTHSSLLGQAVCEQS